MIEDVFLFTMVESIKLIITGQNTFYLLPLMQQLKMLHEKKINIPPISVRLFLNPSFRAEISDMSCHIYYTHTKIDKNINKPIYPPTYIVIYLET